MIISKLCPNNSIYYSRSSKEEKLNFCYLVQKESQDVFNCLSNRIYSKFSERIIGIKKNPLFKDNTKEGRYLVLDNMLLLDKFYTQFINDFWFDFIKHIKLENGKNKYHIRKYRGDIGYFFEGYIEKILTECFSKYSHSKYLIFDDLKMNTPEGAIEFSDFYLRNVNKIIIAEVKSSPIYDNEKYSGEIGAFYKNDRNKFFNTYGVNQVSQSIIELDKMVNLDPKFPVGKTKKVYPVIFVNDKSFQTGLMNHIFNERLNELLKGKINTKKIKIKSLSLIHINDLELMSEYISNSPNRIWTILEAHSKSKNFTPPFYTTINKFIGEDFTVKKLLPVYGKLIEKYNNEE